MEKKYEVTLSIIVNKYIDSVSKNEVIETRDFKTEVKASTHQEAKKIAEKGILNGIFDALVFEIKEK